MRLAERSLRPALRTDVRAHRMCLTDRGKALADTTESARHGFTPEQMDWIEGWLEALAIRSNGDRSGEVSMFKRATGGLVVLGLATTGYLSAQIQSVEDGLRGEIAVNREGIAENRAVIADFAKGLARIEAFLDERLLRGR